MALIDAVEAIGGADAGADVVLAPFRDFLDDMRIGDMGARHADHVELALGDGVARGGDIVDARGVEHRELGCGAHFAGEIEMRRSLHAHHRDDLGKRRIVLDMAADDVEKVDEARILQPAADLEAFLLAEALFPILVGDQAAADDEVGPDRLAHCFQHRKVKRRRLSSEPLYSSPRWLVAGDQN